MRFVYAIVTIYAQVKSIMFNQYCKNAIIIIATTYRMCHNIPTFLNTSIKIELELICVN